MADYVVTEWDDEGNPVDGYFDEDYSNEGGNIEAVGEDDDFDYSLGATPVGEGPVAIGGTFYTQNPDGSWDGDDGSTFTAADFQVYKDSLNAIGDTDLPGAGGTVGGVTIPEGLRLPGATGGSGGQSEQSILDKITGALGVKKPNGDYDWEKILGLAGTAIGTVGAMTQTPQRQATMEELMAMMPKSNTAPMWTEAELAFGRRPMQTGTDLQRIYAADMPSPVTPGKNYADGGEIEGDMEGALASAFAGGVRGADGGQSDLININVSPGEYVFDAESVSALGDGNTEAGIAKLDELREQLRAQKRSAPLGEIPPPAQGPLSYIQGA